MKDSKTSNQGKEISLDQLAAMVQNGFAEEHKRTDAIRDEIHARLKAIENRLERDFSHHYRLIERLNDDMRRVKTRLKMK